MRKGDPLPKDLVIVESPAKARTVGRFLGKDYEVKASLGHVRDLPAREFGVDPEHEFKPKYVQVEGRENVIRDIKKAAKDAERVYLATDPDREGEAISWHVVEAAGLKNALLRRVVFHEITDDAIHEAFQHPREIDMRLVSAQQARRILDRVVGYRLSPVLWGKVRRGLSAGRVQSVALRLIVDREREIEQFKPEEYWTIQALLAKVTAGDTADAFKAALHSIEGRKGQLRVRSGDEARQIVSDLNQASFAVREVTTKETKSRPAPPFITSTLQQEAARRLNFSAERTMRLAQQLYEGVSLGSSDESVGLITYMRTDSTNLAASALAETNEFIKKEYGDEYADKPRTYRTRSKLAQEAHEAIRPTSVLRKPDDVAQFLTPEQRRLYDLIWKRMVASQMKDAVSDLTTAEIAATDTPTSTTYLLRASGTVLKFKGFRAVYMEAREDGESDEEESSRELVPLSNGEKLNRREILSEQKFTQPPPRYSEAMLIRTLEEKGVGRPSTFASIVSTIERREYVVREKRRFKPTKLGVAVCDFLTTWFPEIMDPGFTSEMETELDAIARGEAQWVPVMNEFYGPFDKQIERTQHDAPRVDRKLLEEESGEICEKCERPMVIKSGRFGKFLSCSGFPECRNSRPLRITADAKCPRDGGDLIQRRSKKGRTFYGCSNYPECDFATNRTPLAEPCPECGKLLVEQGRSRAMCTECGWRGPRPSESDPGEESTEAVAAAE